MPLKAGQSRATIRANIEEMLRSPTFARGRPRAKRVQMAVAAALAKARLAKRIKRSKARRSAGEINHLAALSLARGGR